MKGTPLFVAPEMIKGVYNEKVDIWSLGVTTFFILTGCCPFDSQNRDYLYNKITEAMIEYNYNWYNLSSSARSFITACLSSNYQERKSAEDLLNHP